MLVPNPSSNCESQPLAALDQFHFNEITAVPVRAVLLPLHRQMDAVPSFLESLNGRAVRDVDHADVVHVGDDVVHLQPAVDGSGAAVDDLGDVDGGVVGDMRVVSSTGD